MLNMNLQFFNNDRQVNNLIKLSLAISLFLTLLSFAISLIINPESLNVTSNPTIASIINTVKDGVLLLVAFYFGQQSIKNQYSNLPLKEENDE